ASSTNQQPPVRCPCRKRRRAMSTDPLATRGAFRFGTKAETLEQLQGVLTEASIPDFCYFSRAEWRSSATTVLQTIKERFGSAMLAVRSSAITEDDARESKAGAFLSRLRVGSHDRSAVTGAIDDVMQSMPGDERDQVLVQLLAEDIAVSGVIM